jgi:hypothetical protein
MKYLHKGIRSAAAFTAAVAAVLAAVLAAMLASCPTSTMAAVPGIPDELKVPAGQVLSLETHATGVQIYECQAGKDDPTHFAWTFKAPQAELFDSAGKKIAKHYAGPTWEANDGSKVIGELVAKNSGPSPTAIPWLLLSAKSTAGTGLFSKTQFIQRLHTTGGTPAAPACGQSQVGTEARVPYTADYLFYAAKP